MLREELPLLKLEALLFQQAGLPRRSPRLTGPGYPVDSSGEFLVISTYSVRSQVRRLKLIYFSTTRLVHTIAAITVDLKAAAAEKGRARRDGQWVEFRPAR